MSSAQIPVVASEGRQSRDGSPPVLLACLQRLLCGGPLELGQASARLVDIAHAFKVSRIGVARLVQGCLTVKFWQSAQGVPLVSGRWPWEVSPSLLDDLCKMTTALRTGGGTEPSRMLAVGGSRNGNGCLLWLESDALRVWSNDEASALQLAALCLDRLLPTEHAVVDPPSSDGDHLKQRLHDASIIVGRLAHDFGNVLTGILGFTELSLGQASQGTLVQQYLKEAYHAAQKGAQLTASLKQFSQRSPGRNLPAALDLTWAGEKSRLQQTVGSRITFRTSFPQDLPAVAVDVESLRQVFVNLIDNAVEAIASKGTVTVEARTMVLGLEECRGLLGNALPGTFIELTIRDTGMGFTPEARKRALNELFFTTKPRHRGLGLASVYGLLAAHRGAMRIEPPSDEGTSVRVWLPVSKVPAPGTNRIRPPSESGGQPSKESLLVVDDEPLPLLMMCTTLERAGYRVQAAVDGAQALATFRASHDPFQLVVSDVVMPGMSGFELVRQLIVCDPQVNVLFTSGHVPDDFAHQDFGGRDFELLAKPFLPEGLLRAVRAALDRNHRRAEVGLARDPRN